ncbi:amidase domain-containing protein (plasmid) [Acaryochloris sp. 'Moss Beach']|uniref:amidase domain-containing protein n=1 Tax=Acaryochloris sp. 'Moss Beach' TaxID=2740837 RepID=UPI0037BEA68E|nr:amidase domain-containing protein [Acaryochloris sp. 'Moss Beach']
MSDHHLSGFVSHPTIGTESVNRSSLLNIGDIVQVGFGNGEGLSHTMVVTRRRASDGMMYLTGHTNPRYLMPMISKLNIQAPNFILGS